MADIYIHIIMIVGAVLAGLLVLVLKDWIFSAFKQATIAKITGQEIEPFNARKLFSGLLNVVSPAMWAKTLSTFFNARVMLVVTLIATIIWAIGHYQGQQAQPIHYSVDDCKETGCLVRLLNDPYLHVKKDGTLDIVDYDKKTILKSIKGSDVAGLNKPFINAGFQRKWIGVGGVGVSASGIAGEIGGGVSPIRFFEWEGDIFLTNKGGYVGASYNLKKQNLKNLNIGIGTGMGYAGDTRFLVYGRISFN